MIVTAVLSTLAGLWLWQFIAAQQQPAPPPAAVTAQQAVVAKALKIGSQRPLFSLPDSTGKVHSVSEWDGKLLLINFWATWCPPCLEEIPGFVRLQAEFSPRGVQFLGVAMDSAENVSRFMAEQHMNYPSLVGPAAAIEIGRVYGNTYGALPFTVVISPAGKVLHTQAGILEIGAARRLIESFLDTS